MLQLDELSVVSVVEAEYHQFVWRANHRKGRNSSDLFLAITFPAFRREITLSRGDSTFEAGRLWALQKCVFSGFIAHCTAASNTCLESYASIEVRNLNEPLKDLLVTSGLKAYVARQ
jgi:hypothetical protein